VCVLCLSADDVYIMYSYYMQVLRQCMSSLSANRKHTVYLFIHCWPNAKVSKLCQYALYSASFFHDTSIISCRQFHYVSTPWGSGITRCRFDFQLSPLPGKLITHTYLYYQAVQIGTGDGKALYWSCVTNINATGKC